MEALTADDSSGANPSSVKSDDSSPRHEGGRGSPPPNCAICLGTCRNKSFTDSCLHQFCFKCLLTWSKVKAECPLCKQNFKSIIHNVRSNHQYDEYSVEQRHEETSQSIDIDNITNATRRFRYRTTLTLPRRETIAIQQLLMQHYPLMADVFPPPAPRPPPARCRRSPAAFRRTVYRHNLWARPLPDFTGRFRDCTPEFYRYNDSQMHRLVPWLNRELHYLLNENIGHISYVMTRILELLPRFHINSPEFREAMHRYFGDRTEHFLHELHCFASTPYDMTGYDRYVQYTTDSRISTMVNEVISSSESEASVDSDIVMVSSSHPPEPPPGPSRLPAPVYPHIYIPQPTTTTDNVIPIETISQSDSDDDDEVMVVGYIKPPQDRTPEVVDLLGSDSDVIVQDSGLPPEPAQSEPQESRPAGSLVKLSLKRQRGRSHGSESDDSTYRPESGARRRRRRSLATATTSDTCRTTPDWSSVASPPSPASYTPPVSTTPSPARSPSPPVSSSSCLYSPFTDSSTTSYSSFERKKKLTKKKSKRKTRKESNAVERNKRKKKRPSRSRHRGSVAKGSSEERRSKRKSHSGKGVKSSKRAETVASEAARARSRSPAQAGPSGSAQAAPAARDPAPPAARDPAPPATATRDVTRRRHENKRLRSVVKVMYRNSGDSSPGSSTLANTPTGMLNGGSNPDTENTKRENYTPPVSEVNDMHRTVSESENTDSDDDLPLNLTVQKTLL